MSVRFVYYRIIDILSPKHNFSLNVAIKHTHQYKQMLNGNNNDNNDDNEDDDDKHTDTMEL